MRSARRLGTTVSCFAESALLTPLASTPLERTPGPPRNKSPNVRLWNGNRKCGPLHPTRTREAATGIQASHDETPDHQSG